MSTASKKFQQAARNIAFDEQHRATIRFNISKYDAAVAKGKLRYSNLPVAKQSAAGIKREAISNLAYYLEQFEANISQRGVNVLWAKDTAEAGTYLQQIIKENKARLLVKSKSMTTEEINLNEVAQAVGCESVETDLGEFIVQIAGEKPYHIVTPAMHKSKEDIARLFHEKFGTPLESTPEQMTAYVRGVLREKFRRADIGVTGANFLIADIGGVSVTENEGNALMSTAFPRVHVVIAGIEKVIPSIQDLGLLLPLLAAQGTGQQITNYNTIFTSARKSDEANGPEKMYVILLDNGRSTLYADPECAIALTCIRCGACLNACPVYKTIGGYTYDTTYSGPIGSVITPFYKGFSEFGHLSFASTLCGACVEVCPVKIPLTDLLLVNRRKMAEKKLTPFLEKAAIKGFRCISTSRKRYEAVPAFLKNWATTPFNYTLWGKKRKMPTFAPTSFSAMYKTNHKK